MFQVLVATLTFMKFGYKTIANNKFSHGLPRDINYPEQTVKT